MLQCFEPKSHSQLVDCDNTLLLLLSHTAFVVGRTVLSSGEKRINPGDRESELIVIPHKQLATTTTTTTGGTKAGTTKQDFYQFYH